MQIKNRRSALLTFFGAIVILLGVRCSETNSLHTQSPSSSHTNPINSSPDAGNFDDWSAMAQGNTVSPAKSVSTSLDLSTAWTGADGKPVQLVVRQPASLNSRIRVTIGPVNSAEDARPYFESALAKAVQSGANTLSLSGGTYNFLTTENANKSHLLLQNLKDFIIEGNGSVLNFSQNSNGILIQQSQRLRLENLTVNYTLLSTSLGRIALQDGHNVLVIDSKYPVNEKVDIFQLAEVEPASKTFVTGGVRLIFAPGAERPVNIGNQTYQFSGFDKLKANTSFLVINQWYGGQAIRVDGFRKPGQTEDITFSKVNLQSTPGMGLFVTGLKRGLALLDSNFAPDPNSTSNYGGVAWDGVHIFMGGGDVLIKGNHFAFLGDDTMNLNFPIHPVLNVDAQGKTITLGNSSRFIAKGDKLAFFDAQGQYSGYATVDSDIVTAGGGNNSMQLDGLPANVTTKSFVRNVSLISSRYAITDNIIENTNGHGVLVQIPNVLVSNNTFKSIDRNAIRLLSSTSWREGVGAFNVAVRNNTVMNGGLDPGRNIPWSAITAYGQGHDGNLQDNLINENIEISDNKLQNLKQGCIAIANSRNVKIKNNTCSYVTSGSTTNVVTTRSVNVVND